LSSEWTDVGFNAAKTNAAQDNTDHEVSTPPTLNTQYTTRIYDSSVAYTGVDSSKPEWWQQRGSRNLSLLSITSTCQWPVGNLQVTRPFSSTTTICCQLVAPVWIKLRANRQLFRTCWSEESVYLVEMSITTLYCIKLGQTFCPVVNL